MGGIIENQPPIAVVDDREKTIECDSPGGALIALNASGGIDADGDIDRCSWYCDKPFSGNVLSESSIAHDVAPLGTTQYFVRVEDGFGQSGFSSTKVEVEDTTPPVVEFAEVGELCLWPPNHDYLIISNENDVRSLVSDRCDARPEIYFKGGSSDQLDNGIGDGNFADDLVVFPTHVCVRAERQGGVLDGREYEVQLVAEDFSGNKTNVNTILSVPHDRCSSRDCVWLDNLETVGKSDPRCDPALARSEMEAFWSEREDASPVFEAAAPNTQRNAGCATINIGRSATGYLVFIFLLMGIFAYRRRRQ